MTSEQRLDLLENLARSLAYPQFGEERRKREATKDRNPIGQSEEDRRALCKPARTLKAKRRRR